MPFSNDMIPLSQPKKNHLYLHVSLCLTAIDAWDSCLPRTETHPYLEGGHLPAHHWGVLDVAHLTVILLSQTAIFQLSLNPKQGEAQRRGSNGTASTSTSTPSAEQESGYPGVCSIYI